MLIIVAVIVISNLMLVRVATSKKLPTSEMTAFWLEHTNLAEVARALIYIVATVVIGADALVVALFIGLWFRLHN